MAKDPAKLTKPQLCELRAQADKGPQACFGVDRSRVQGRLVELGLSVFKTRSGQVTRYFPDRCEITDEGRKVIGKRKP